MFRANPSGLKRILAAGDAERAMREKADAVTREAQNIAPVETGAYRESLRTETQLGPDGWEAQTVTDDEAWPFLEFGTSDTPTFAPLRRALEGSRE